MAANNNRSGVADQAAPQGLGDHPPPQGVVDPSPLFDRHGREEQPALLHDAHALVMQACERLVGHVGVYNVWIVLLRDGLVVDMASSFEAGFESFRERMKKGWKPHCFVQALQHEDVVILENVDAVCGDCLLAQKYNDRVALACSLRCGDQVYGVLRASAPAYMAKDEKIIEQLKTDATEIATILDRIYEREQIEAELRESRRRLASLMANLPGMAYRCRNDKDWTMEFVSEGCFELTGYERSALEMSRIVSYVDLIHPDDRAKVEEGVRAGIERGGAFTVEYRIIDARGRERWVWERGCALPSGGDEKLMLEGFIADITDRLKLQEEMIALKKEESLSLMAGGVAHDFNNYLTTILGNAEVALADLPPGTNAYAGLKQIIKASRQAAGLCRQMLHFCGRSNSSPQPLDLSSLLEGMKVLLASMHPPGIQIEYELDAELPGITADPSDIRQMMVQVVNNAVEAYGGRDATIRITSGVQEYDGRPMNQLVFPEGPLQGRYVCIRVIDNGCGMSDETKRRMFDPFYSTKMTGRGMGLPAVLGILRSLNGRILVSSSHRKGTVISLLLSLSDALLLPSGGVVAPTASNKPRPVKTLLFADDEVPLLALCTKILEREGYTLHTVTNGAEAVALYEARRDEIDLVLLDLTMPVMGGVEAFKRIRALQPAARIAFTTGYSAEDIKSQVDVSTLVGILLKPFGRESLLALLKAAEQPCIT